MTTIRSLCSGYGGLDLAVEHATGGHLVDHAEVDPHAAKIHEAHWPGISNLGDITTLDWSTLEPTDALCAGYPCQPFSQAGRRQGASDVRHLWPVVAARPARGGGMTASPLRRWNALIRRFRRRHVAVEDEQVLVAGVDEDGGMWALIAHDPDRGDA